MKSCTECLLKLSRCPLSGKVPETYRGPCSEFRQAGLGAVIKAEKVSQPKQEHKTKGPNKTEQSYHDAFLRGKDARYEAITFRMSNGHRYTPDWCVFDSGRLVECHECKGGYELGSQQRARLAFDQCATEFAPVRFIWARKGKSGWEVSK